LRTDSELFCDDMLNEFRHRDRDAARVFAVAGHFPAHNGIPVYTEQDRELRGLQACGFACLSDLLWRHRGLSGDVPPVPLVAVCVKRNRSTFSGASDRRDEMEALTRRGSRAGAGE